MFLVITPSNSKYLFGIVRHCMESALFAVLFSQFNFIFTDTSYHAPDYVFVMKCVLISPLIVSIFLNSTLAQTVPSYSTAQAFSYNDHHQLRPFSEAYDQQFGSIETDVFLQKEILYAVNNAVDASPSRMLSKLYLQPVSEHLDRNAGQIYTLWDNTLQLIFDLKTPAKETLPALIQELEKFKNLTEPNGTIKIIITGNIPSPDSFDQYPSYISFEGVPDVAYTPKQLTRIALIGQSFQKYSRWNGEGSLPRNDRQSIMKVIQKVHETGKKIRFRDAPDNINTWKIMMGLKVDYLGTGKVIQMGDYLRTAPR